MRRFIIGTGMLALTLAALTPARARAQMGLKAGVSFSDATNTGALPGNPKTRSGYSVGLAMEPSGFLGVGVEGLYSRRGLDNSNEAYQQQTDYIDIPVYLRVKLGIPGLSPFAYAGPQFSYEMKCTQNGADCPTSGQSKWSDAAVIGAGIRLAGGITAEGRYLYGLSNLNYSTVTTTSNYKTRTFMLLAGIGF